MRSASMTTGPSTIVDTLLVSAGSKSSVRSTPISALSYMPEKVAGNARRSAVTIAHFSIITEGMVFHSPRLLLNSLKVTVTSTSTLRSFLATRAQPPTISSPLRTSVPVRLSILSPAFTITPEVMPANCGCASARFIKASFPTTIVAAPSPYLMR